MRKLNKVVVALALAASVAGVASADKKAAEKWHSNSENFAGAWYYPWVGPNTGPGGFQESGAPFHGVSWSKKYQGEVTYVDSQRIQIKADGSGDLITFFLYEGVSTYTPSHANLRVGSKVKVTSDDRHRARNVHVTPFYKWLKEKTK